MTKTTRWSRAATLRAGATRLARCAVVAAAVASSLPRPARAQATDEEEAAVLLSAARDFLSEGRPEVARLLFQRIVQRYPLTSSADEARERLDQLAGSSADEVSDSDGRTELAVWGTAYGLFLGVAVPTALGADGSAPYGVGLLLGGPGGLLAARALAGSRDLTVGQARAITFAGTWGTWQGAGWRDVLDIGEQQLCGPVSCSEVGSTTEETFTAMIAGGLLGVALGTSFSTRNISPGVASAVNFGSLWGSWIGLAGGILVDLDGDELLASTLVGGDVGLLYAALAAPHWDVSRSRARRVSITGVIGGMVGAGMTLIAETENDKVLIGVPLATSLIGLGFGAAATRDVGSGGGDQDAGAGDALFELRGGALSVGAPLPFPTLAERTGPSGPRRGIGVGLTLLRATF